MEYNTKKYIRYIYSNKLTNNCAASVLVIREYTLRERSTVT